MTERIENEIGDSGVKMVFDALKCNNSLSELILNCDEI